MNRSLSVHTVVLDEIDPDGDDAYLFRSLRRAGSTMYQEKAPIEGRAAVNGLAEGAAAPGDTSSCRH